MSETISLWIAGMRCSGCASGVEKALLKAPGVTAATVSLESGRAEVTIDPTVAAGDPVAPRLIEAVERAGFDASLAA